MVRVLRQDAAAAVVAGSSKKGPHGLGFVKENTLRRRNCLCKLGYLVRRKHDGEGTRLQTGGRNRSCVHLFVPGGILQSLHGQRWRGGTGLHPQVAAWSQPAARGVPRQGGI